VSFDRNEGIRSSFKEDRKSNEASKTCRKQGKATHDRAPGSTAVPQQQWPRTAVHPTMHGRTACCASQHGRAVRQPRAIRFFLRLFNCFSFTFGRFSRLLLRAL